LIRFSIRLLQGIKEWLSNAELQPTQWAGMSIELWWRMTTSGAIPNCKALASFTLLATWEIQSERNAKVFYNKHALTLLFYIKI
jgi:hypothetical protein